MAGKVTVYGRFVSWILLCLLNDLCASGVLLECVVSNGLCASEARLESVVDGLTHDTHRNVTVAVEGLKGILGACASRVSECVVGNGVCVEAFLVCVGGVAPNLLNQGSDDTYLGSCWVLLSSPSGWIASPIRRYYYCGLLWIALSRIAVDCVRLLLLLWITVDCVADSSILLLWITVDYCGLLWIASSKDYCG